MTVQPAPRRDPNALIVGVAVAAIAGLAAGAPGAWDAAAARPGAFIAFVALTLVLQLITVEVYGRGAISFAGTGILAVGFTFGTGAAMWTGAAMGAVNLVARRGHLNRGVFDASQWALAAGAGAGLFQLAGGNDLRTAAGFGVAIGASALYMVVNIGLLSTAMGLAEGAPLVAVWQERFRWFTPYYLVSGPLAFAVTVAYERVGVLGLVAFALPPAMMIVSANQYLKRTQQAAEEVRHANADLQRANEAIRESEERFRAIFESSAIGIRLADLDGRVLAVNRSLEQVLGYDEGELAGTSLADVTHPDDLANHVALLADLVGGARESYELEQRFLRRDGVVLWSHLTASLVRDADGRPEFAIAMVQDVTERKQLEEQLREAQKMEAVGRLAGGIAHDFNNLLTVIGTYSTFALRQLGTTDDDLRQDIEEIRKAGERAAALTQQLLALSRRQVLQPQVLDLNAVVADIYTMLRRLIGENIEVVTDLGAALSPVQADPGQVEQVLINLVLNARDAMADGGRLTIATTNADLQLPRVQNGVEAAPGPYVVLTVEDTGCGMDEATLRRIFEPFFTTKEQGKGTGLGLSTVHGIVAQSGGAVFVASGVDAGTRIEVYLPRASGMVARATEAASGAAGPASAETVLLVEDEDVVRFAARRILRESGYRVLEAFDGIEALRVAESHRGPIHLLLTDVVMPRLGGPELVEQLGSLRPDLKVLYMSGYTDQADVARGVAGDEAGFLQKPFTQELLALKVRSLLDAAAIGAVD